MNNVFSVKDAPGILADGKNDDYASLQNFLDSLPEGATLNFENYRVLCSQPIVIRKPILITAGGFTASLIAVTDGIIVESENVIIENISIGAIVRYSKSKNSNYGIKVNGNKTKHIVRITINNVLFDGFKKAITINYMGLSQIMAIKVYYCNIGIEINGESVNNEISNNCALQLVGEESYGIHFVGDVKNEGWRIIDTLIYGAKYGIWAEQTSHVNVLNSMIDFCTWIGIYVGSHIDPLNPEKIGCLNWNISNNYIAMNGNGGSAIYLNNHVKGNSEDCRGHKITNNDMLVYIYPGSTAHRGIHQEGTYSKYDLIQGNSFKNFDTFDIETAEGTFAIVTNNFMLSKINSVSCYASSDTILSNNITKGNIVVK